MDAVEWLAPAIDTIYLNLSRPDETGKQTDVFPDDFHPLYTHQLFDDDIIFGYKDLELKLSFREHDLRPTHIFHYSSQLPKIGKLEAVNFKEVISQFVPASAFDAAPIQVSDLTGWTPPGRLAAEYTAAGKKYQIWKAPLLDPRAKEIFTNMRILIPFFIEGGTCMELDDSSTQPERWSIYFLYQLKDDHDLCPNEARYSFVGFSTVFKWWSFPDEPAAPAKTDAAQQTNDTAPPSEDATPAAYFKPSPDGSFTDISSRLCLSQFVVLPPYQRQGHGTHLYQTVFADAHADPTVTEFCVEDPGQEFDYLRDFCDFTRLYSLNSFKSLRLPASQPVQKVGPDAPIPMSLILPVEQTDALHRESKLTRRQFERMLEIYLFSQFPTDVRNHYVRQGREIAEKTIQADLVSAEPASAPSKITSPLQDFQYALWTLLVKNRIYAKNEDVLIQLEPEERADKIGDSFVGVQSEYAEWIEQLIDGGHLSDDTLLSPPAQGQKRKNEDREDEEGDDGDSVLGRHGNKRRSAEPSGRAR